MLLCKGKGLLATLLSQVPDSLTSPTPSHRNWAPSLVGAGLHLLPVLTKQVEPVELFSVPYSWAGIAGPGPSRLARQEKPG